MAVGACLWYVTLTLDGITTMAETAAGHRQTIGIVGRVAPSGTVFVHELATNKLGYISNTTPIAGQIQVRPGMRLSLEVEDRGDVMVVAAARTLP